MGWEKILGQVKNNSVFILYVHVETATVKELKEELKSRPQKDLVELCLRLSVFKKENKELLTYLLFESADEDAFIRAIKNDIHNGFKEINLNSFYYIKKSVRKILRETKKYIRYSKKKETEVELLLCFCSELKKLRPSVERNYTLHNILIRQVAAIRKTVSTLHEDLQYDYTEELKKIL